MSRYKFTKTSRQIFEYKKQLVNYLKCVKNHKLLYEIRYEKRTNTQSNNLIFLTKKIRRLKKTIKFVI